MDRTAIVEFLTIVEACEPQEANDDGAERRLLTIEEEETTLLF
jgi:hypothetical protein